MIQIQQELERILFSGPLMSIKLFQVNENFFEFSRDGFWIIDCGIELIFAGGTISAAWNSQLELLTLHADSVKNIYSQDNLIQLENENIIKLNRFMGLKVVDSEFKTLEFDYVADYTMRIEKEERFVELVLYFENKLCLQIAFIDYSLHENKAPSDFLYDLNNQILISTKQILAIRT